MPLFYCVSCTDGSKAETPQSSLLCLGNFDGVHMAHRQLIKDTVALAEKLNATPAVWFFDPPASDHLGNGHNRHLSTLEEKLAIFSDVGIKYAFAADFPTLKDIPSYEFTELLKSECNAVGVCCGYDFRFGKDGKGKSADLQAAFGEKNINITQMITLNGKRVSSTVIRDCLESGDIQTATRMLGDYYSYTSPAVRGKQLGRTLGFPTANQYIPDGKLIPRHGVYASFCTIDGKSYPAVTNIGERPTVDDGNFVNSESHIIGFSGDLYGKPVRTSLLGFIRDEVKYPDTDSLRQAIESDKSAAVDIFNQSEVSK